MRLSQLLKVLNEYDSFPNSLRHKPYRTEIPGSTFFFQIDGFVADLLGMWDVDLLMNQTE